MFQSRAFRLFVAACVIAVLGLLIHFGLFVAGLSNAEEPRNATPVEIAQAALDGQIEAMRKAGFDVECLFQIEVFGKICVEQCVALREEGFALQLQADHPSCSIESCTCEDGAEFSPFAVEPTS